MSTVTAHWPRHALGRPWDRGPGLGWLTTGERETYGVFRDASRRQAWLLGRLLAKEVLLERALGTLATWSDAGRLEICSRDGLGRSIAPRVFLDGRVQPWSLSIAHSDASILVALSCDAGVWVGADLVPCGAFGARGLDAWLSPREREWLGTAPAGERPARASILWAIKEATYKAVGGGERFMPRRVEACAGPADSWRALVDGRAIAGTVRVATTETEVAAVVTVGGRPSEAAR
jgi:hypothetical protein